MHNNYLTLPVIFLMLSNHYPLAWSSRYAVAILGLVVVAGAIVRHFFNAQHAGKGSPWWTWGVAAACFAVAIYLSIARQAGQRRPGCGSGGTVRGRRSERGGRSRHPVALLDVPCRPSPSGTGSPSPRRGSASTRPRRSPATRRRSACRACITHAMPPNNITEMTLDERRAVAGWLARRDRALR